MSKPKSGGASKSGGPSGGPARSGGGINSRVVRAVGIKGGSPTTRQISPGAVSRIGHAVGNHSERGTVQQPPQPLVTGAAPQVALGNASAKAGHKLTLHGPSGSQGQHGPASYGTTPIPRDILSEFGPETKKG